MMFGTRESFEYAECGACGTVWLVEQPANMAAYYPADYYSADPGESLVVAHKRLRRRLKTEVALRAPADVVRMARLDPGERPLWFRGYATTRSRIVDIGCGGGHNLRALWNAGFQNLAGYDPFFDGAADAPFTVHRQMPDWFAGHFDVAMMHHAFEHVPNPVEQLEMLKGLLRPGGKILLRIPLADSWAWQHYGINWVQLDPPRHFWLLTDKAMEILAQRTGLRVVSRWRDSTALQIWGSDLYEADQPLHASKPGDVSAQTARADALNAQGRGDQGAFWLQHA